MVTPVAVLSRLFVTVGCLLMLFACGTQAPVSDSISSNPSPVAATVLPLATPIQLPTATPLTESTLSEERQQAIALVARGWHDERIAFNYQSALELYSAAITLDPTYAEAWLHRAVLNDRMKQPQASTDDLNTGLALNPPAHIADHFAARLATTYKDKLRLYNRAVEAAPEYLPALLGRGMTHTLYGRYGAAERDLNEVIERDPTLAEAWHFRAQVYAEQGDFEAAREQYDQALALEPDFVLALGARGMLRARWLGEPAEGVADLEQVTRLVPGRAELWCDLGQARVYNDDAEGALANFATAIALDPAYACTYYQRARVYLALGQLDAALADVNTYLTYASSLEAYVLRSMILEQQGDLEAALLDAETAVANQPHNPTGYEQRGNVYVALGDSAAALQDYQQAVALYEQYGLFAQAAQLTERIDALNGEGTTALSEDPTR
jgi:tetratricopeptide (TPR) repeat protein